MNNKTKTILLMLVAAVMVIYWPVINFDFIKYDDNLYVTNNLHVQGGLTAEGIKWAFTTIDAGFWHPLTWLSLMLDYELYGLNAGGYHWTNVILHLLNTLLLFLVLLRMTGQLWKSSFVAALFAIHPLHVESVAWVAERKDVLSTLFWMLTTVAYVFYAARPSLSRYLGIVVFFILGLMAKPMLVTLPFVFLLLDYWPLKRIQRIDGAVLKRLIGEKAPLFMIAIIFSIVTFYAETHLGAVPSQTDFPMSARIVNAIVSYSAYIGKMVWPASLSFYYPHPGMRPIGQIALSAAFLVLVTCWVVVCLREQPYLSVGWFFYLGTLVPVIGIVQVGGHAMADRYTYIPLIGLFIMMAWGMPELITMMFRKGKAIAAVCAAIVLSLLSVLCFFQVRIWQDSISLFTNAVDINRNDGKLQHLLGYALMEQGHLEEGIVHFREAARLENDDNRLHYNLAVALSRSGKDEEAIPHYLKALQINPLYGDAYYSLGQLYERLGRNTDAKHCYEQALDSKMNSSDLYNRLALVLSRMDMYKDAEKIYAKAIILWPEHAGLRNNFGMVLKSQGLTDEAIDQFRSALRFQGDYANAHYELGLLLNKQGNKEEARFHLKKAASINPSYK